MEKEEYLTYKRQDQESQANPSRGFEQIKVEPPIC